MATFIDAQLCVSKGELFSEVSPFPDGQPHVTLLGRNTGLRHDGTRVLNCRVSNPKDLLNVALAINVLKHHGASIVLNIYYLMGARMDRRLSPDEPYTLKVICDIINSFGCKTVRVFCPHSQATSDLLDNFCSMEEIEDHFFRHAIGSCFSTLNSSWIDEQQNTSLVFPDHGALKRFGNVEFLNNFPFSTVVTMEKDRDERTGKVRGIKHINGDIADTCVIVDDLCDGGRTFEECSKALRTFATKVGLVVPHAIMSKGVSIPGIDHIITTNSYKEWSTEGSFKVFKL